jgi:hypothetical protein
LGGGEERGEWVGAHTMGDGRLGTHTMGDGGDYHLSFIIPTINFKFTMFLRSFNL